MRRLTSYMHCQSLSHEAKSCLDTSKISITSLESRLHLRKFTNKVCEGYTRGRSVQCRRRYDDFQ